MHESNRVCYVCVSLGIFFGWRIDKYSPWADRCWLDVEMFGRFKMTKSQIKAELRRSAMEDCDYMSLSLLAQLPVIYFSDWPRFGLGVLKQNDKRTFFLLCAEAL